MTELNQNTVLARLALDDPWRDLVEVLQQVDSTNDHLKRLAAQGAPQGTACVADCQTGGHGRRGRNFDSPAHTGVYLSVLLRPKCPPTALMHLTCAVAVAMCDAVERAAGFRPGIKWINDLVHQGRKLGGILTELGFTPAGALDYAIVGIGINCGQTIEDFPPALRQMAGSLAMAAGRQVDRAALAAAMLEELRRMSGTLLTGRERMLRRYREDCVTLGQQVALIRGEEVRHGLALDVDADGALLVAFPDGHTEAVSSGEASVRGMYGYV